MENEIDIDGIKVHKSIIYNAALAVLNNLEDRLNYIDSISAYEKYEMLDIMKAFGRPNYFKERFPWPEMDRWEDATGEFGLEPTNPIIVTDLIGKMAYLSHLRWNDKPVIFFGGGSTKQAVMSSYVFSLDGDHLDRLYFDIFHRYQTKSIPRGYTWAEKADGLTGSTCVIQEKFEDTIKLIYSDAQGMFGVPVVSPQVRRFNVEAASRLWYDYKKSRSKG